MKKNSYAVIMAGGQGTRLWPLSRRKKPKQLHSLMTDRAMIRDTFLRLLPIFTPEKIIISTVPDFVDEIKKILPEVPKENYIAEPFLMGNAAACGLVSAILNARDKNSEAIFLPADAFIRNEKEFIAVLNFALELIAKYQNNILTIGIKPTRPDVNYGYIKASKTVDEESRLKALLVECFVEKPDKKTAEKYFKSGDYFWNSGIFLWRTDHILNLFEKYLPKTYDALSEIQKNIDNKNIEKIIKENYAKVDKTSIDYGIIEKEKDILTIPADFGWSDVGTWESLFELLAELKNSDLVVSEHHIGIDSKNCFVRGHDKLIATIGLDNIIVVDSPDAILICDKKESHRVKEIMEKIEEKYL